MVLLLVFNQSGPHIFCAMLWMRQQGHSGRKHRASTSGSRATSADKKILGPSTSTSELLITH
jgi:hypothetical protein